MKNLEQVKFENFVNSADLIKIGARIIHFIKNEEGLYNKRNFVRALLKRAGVENATFCDALSKKAITAYFFDALFNETHPRLLATIGTYIY